MRELKEVAAGEITLLPGVTIACAVLDNEMRVLTTRGVSRAFGSRKTGTNITKTGAPQPPPFLANPALVPFLSEHLIVLLGTPVEYRPIKGGRTAYGYDCAIFPEICKAIVDADRAGKMKAPQRSLVKFAVAFREALIGVGMIALVDEATGYQATRARDDLQRILAAYVVPEMLPWLKRFPDEFFKETYKIMGWKYEAGAAKRPQFVGKVINEWIYKRLPSPVLPKLQELNPSVEGRRRHKHHQHLTDETGIPHLDKQIVSVTALMRAAIDRRQFEELLVRSFPVRGDQMPLGTATN